MILKLSIKRYNRRPFVTVTVTEVFAFALRTLLYQGRIAKQISLFFGKQVSK